MSPYSTATSDQAVLPEPASEPPPPPARRGPGPVFWVMLALGIVCVVAGFAVARFGPLWFPAERRPAPMAPPAPPAPAAPDTPAAVALDARLADIQARLTEREQDAAAREQIVVASAEVAALGDRLDRMERRQQSALDAAAAALAVASLDQAAQGSGSFSEQLAAVERFLPASTDARRLRILADAGAPSRAALAAEFPQMASRAVEAARAGAPGEGLLARIGRALANVVTIRRIDGAGGSGVDAVLARAEALANDGDLTGALAELERLPPAARPAAEDWRRRAARRLEVDQRLAAIRTAALKRLADREENLTPPVEPLGPGL